MDQPKYLFIVTRYYFNFSKAMLQGNSRSAAVLAAYLMWKRGMTHTEALELIRQKRGFIDPNIGFVGYLMDFHKRLI